MVYPTFSFCHGWLRHSLEKLTDSAEKRKKKSFFPVKPELSVPDPEFFLVVVAPRQKKKKMVRLSRLYPHLPGTSIFFSTLRPLTETNLRQQVKRRLMTRVNSSKSAVIHHPGWTIAKSARVRLELNGELSSETCPIERKSSGKTRLARKAETAAPFQSTSTRIPRCVSAS